MGLNKGFHRVRERIDINIYGLSRAIKKSLVGLYHGLSTIAYLEKV